MLLEPSVEHPTFLSMSSLLPDFLVIVRIVRAVDSKTVLATAPHVMRVRMRLCMIDA
jgi:hypothetical protein